MALGFCFQSFPLPTTSDAATINTTQASPDRRLIPLSKTKETNVLFEGFREMRYAESFDGWVLS